MKITKNKSLVFCHARIPTRGAAAPGPGERVRCSHGTLLPCSSDRTATSPHPTPQQSGSPTASGALPRPTCRNIHRPRVPTAPPCSRPARQMIADKTLKTSLKGKKGPTMPICPFLPSIIRFAGEIGSRLAQSRTQYHCMPSTGFHTRCRGLLRPHTPTNPRSADFSRSAFLHAPCYPLLAS
jgi:hypothetical protein